MVRKLLRGTAICFLGLLLAWGATGSYFFLTDGEAWPERAPVPPSGAFVRETGCFHGGGYDEWMADLRRRNGRWHPLGWALALVFPRADYERAQASVDCRFVRYESDGYSVAGFMLAPRGEPGVRLPVLVYNRGGNGGFGALNFAHALQTLVPYAQQGFLVLASQYRGSDESDPAKFGKDEFGGAEVRDVEALIALVDRLPQADPDNIFLLGHSRGVMMNYLVARRSERIRALASINGVTDLEAELAFRPEMENVYVERIPDYATRKSQALAERSVAKWADQLPRAMPILLLHGGQDERVDPANGARFKAQLDALGHPNKLVFYPDDDHGLRGHRAQAQAEVVAWFRAHARAAATQLEQAATRAVR
jgi:dipeptidyl aminopeptidase/acylaminoacyl peptidase